MPCLTQRLPSPPKVALELRSDGLLLAQKLGERVVSQFHPLSGLVAAPALLARAVRATGLRGQPALVLLQAGDYHLHLMPLPALAPCEHEAALRWQLRERLDCPPDEVELQSFSDPLSEPPAHGHHLHVATARRSVLRDLTQVLEDAELLPEAIGIPELPLARLVAALTSVEQPAQDRVLMVFSGREVLALVARNGRYCMGRRVPLPEPLAASGNRDERDERLDIGSLEYSGSAIQYCGEALTTLLLYFASRSHGEVPQQLWYACEDPAQELLALAVLRHTPCIRPQRLQLPDYLQPAPMEHHFPQSLALTSALCCASAPGVRA